MRVKIQTLIAALFFVSISVAVPVQAQDATTADSVEMTTLETTADDQTTVATDETIADRITKYKAKKTDKLAAFQERRIMTRCKAAQGLLVSVHERTVTAVKNRQTTYQAVQEKLDTLIDKLQAANIDTASLEAAREDISVEVENLRISFEEYQTLLSDLSLMECEADPTAFKAALDLAREETVAIRDQAASLKNMIALELKTLLQTARTELAGASDTANTVNGDDSVSESESEE